MPKQLPNDVFNALIDGLTELTLIRLPYAPAAKGLPNVANAWEKALLAKMEWHEKSAQDDAMRLKVAFSTLLAESERWPLPKDLLSNLPPRPPPIGLPKPPHSECPMPLEEMFGDTLKNMKA